MNRPLFLASGVVLSPLIIVVAIIPTYAQNPFDNPSTYTVSIDGKSYTAKYNIMGDSLKSIKAKST